MKTSFHLLIAALGGVALFASAAVEAQVHVRGHIRKDGTYVQPHVRTAPNRTKLDNYSTRPNVNPYTGKQGTVDPYPSYPRTQPRVTPHYRGNNTARQRTGAYSPPCYFNCGDN